MSTYIITGNYTSEAARGMLATPSDRAEAVKPMIEKVGGTMIAYYATLGAHDFMMVLETDDFEGLCAALMLVGSSGGVSNLSTSQAISTADFMSVQKRAGQLAGTYTAPS